MKSKKQNEDLRNTSIGKMSLDDCDKMIKRLLKNEEAVKSFIKSSQTDGVSTKEIQGQLQYFGIKYLLK